MWVLVKNNVAEMIIVYDGVSAYEPPPEYVLEYVDNPPENFNIGWIKEGNIWVSP